ncbi:MAG: replicative DNA helicase [Actinomyces urogenitalis]|uniref:replicative DNA helicase n=2 Tax=Actinomyces urogenitalis TaxID=103621 RepID=UPI0009DF42EA|nr:replicative DNA helicase [Actinomyces urogenitalis]MBS6073089.1 replicative DNA helicase [Actinomyces urogenitalis]MDU0865256.1 replicative DNA helicase [Actinomyces urogenitalis]MDU0875598.1 replicative DNA helicase [Actinomyces urogenitalis]MDU1565424.1 replicative DNA helicase [Actinomyces urogenitalis]MDU1640772.1 replicative DNA helicase [Actinomyces urogenitalis]
MTEMDPAIEPVSDERPGRERSGRWDEGEGPGPRGHREGGSGRADAVGSGGARFDGVFDRVPPQDLAAEMATLGGMLMSKEAITDVIEVLRGPEFYKPAHEMIFDAIVEVYNRSQPADALLVGDELAKRGELELVGGAPYLADLMGQVPTAANAGYYARIVKEKSLMRGLVQAGTRITQLGYSTDAGDIDELVTMAEAEVYAVAHREGEREDYSAVGELLNDANMEIEAGQSREHGQMTGVATGFAELDELTGGLKGGQMIIVAARPAMGKSTLAVDFCRSASIHARDHNGNPFTSCYFSLEMGRMELMMRILSAESGVEMTKLRGGKLMDDRDWKDVASVYHQVSEAPLFIDDSPNLTMPEIRSKALRLKQQQGLGLMVIDYLQLMSSGKRVESRQQEVSEFSRSLKLLAKELDIPVVAVAQLNRGPEQRTGNKPQMSDLRESGSLEQDADIIMLLHRPEYYQPEERPGEADIIVAKHRNGSTRTIPVAFQGHLSRFANMARDMAPEPEY